MPIAFSGDLIQETTTTTGTGDYTLGGAVDGYQTFASWFTDTNLIAYCARDDAGNFETGVGTFNATPGTITRNYVWWSSNAGSPVNWASGTRKIYPCAIGGFNGMGVQQHVVQTGGSTTFPGAGVGLANGWAEFSHYINSVKQSVAICVAADGSSSTWRFVATADAATNTLNCNSSNILGGMHNQTDQSDSIAMGWYAHATHPAGVVNGATRSGGALGSHQQEKLVAALQTTDATPTRMQIYGGSTNRITQPAASAWMVKAKVVAWNSAGNVASCWEATALFKRNGSGNVTLVGSVAGTTAVAQDGGAAAWAVTLAADTSNQAVDINVTGAAATTINWTADVTIVQVL